MLLFVATALLWVVVAVLIVSLAGAPQQKTTGESQVRRNTRPGERHPNEGEGVDP
jgi:hypothetical protein